MQVIVKHKIEDELILPINYNHILQSVIYSHINNGDSSYQNLHNEGYQFGKRNYRLIVFSFLRGKYKISGKQIIFYDEIEFEIRSPEVRFICQVAESIKKNGLTYGKQHFQDIEVLLQDYEIECNEIRISPVTPICVYSTQKDTYTKYYNPWEEEFYRKIQDNFIRKYEAYYHIKPQTSVELLPAKIVQKDKFVTRYKNTYITGWYGEFILKGERKYLNFLYQAGLGSKNSQGLGMFRVIGE